jgi:glyoxylase-like metal-dependent hydrolase (beta-lactamase superfamily II)
MEGDHHPDRHGAGGVELPEAGERSLRYLRLPVDCRRQRRHTSTVPAVRYGQPVTTEPIDLVHAGNERTIGAYLVETDDGPALFDCGPATCVPKLFDGLADRGVDLRDIRHLLLSHIHLDHAGAAGVLVREHPELQVHVSEAGAPHLIDPSRLEASARRLYGDAFDALWGELAAVPSSNLHLAEGDVVGLQAFPTPGHAWHHVSYLHGDGTLYAGDAAGVRIVPARFVLPPLPPPDVDLEAWESTIGEIERRGPARLALVHFGVFNDVESHLGRLRETLRRWAEHVEHGMDEATFVTAARADVAASDPEQAQAYDRAAPYWHCYRGLERYWRKRREAAS